MRQLILTAPGLGRSYRTGDVVPASSSRVKQLKELLVRPRMRYVGRVVSIDTLEIIERRMTWYEWRAALLDAIVH
jgi:hypothetical protein